ncbi:MFS transporter [Kitasatospora sp. MMS16-BH015]|uniref:MFS transporter n=1 Tax=Kitasatospora sp. MMS16-BH015 TaxID=2018025 RepID=UPI000CA278D4|nr:MFS transporter [Kitasatospora sp. MMS16-BH015]AUG78426.1 MFS transporter [Kitasatospora sp. MMS16-BH015]
MTDAIDRPAARPGGRARRDENGGSSTARSEGSRAFWRYFTASTVSNTGTAVTGVALPLIAVTTLHAGSFEISLLTAAGSIAWLLISLPAGVLVQRVPLRGVQVSMDLARAAAIASVPAAAALGLLSLAQLVVVTLVVGFATVVFDVANSSFLPSIVPTEELTARNSTTSAAFSATQLGGPSLGGLLVQLLGGAASLLVDTASYLCSAALLRSLPSTPPAAAPGAARVPFLEQIKEGLRFVLHHPVIRICVALATLVNFGCGALMALMPVFLVRTLGAPAGVVGLLMATDGLGSLLLAARTPALGRRYGSARALLLASLVGTATAFLMPLAGHGWGLVLFALGNAGFSAGVVVLSILTRTHRQTVAPPELLPRVMASVRFISWGAVPLGALTAGAVATATDPRTALLLTCLGLLSVPAVLLAGPLRRLRELTDSTTGNPAPETAPALAPAPETA